MVWSVGEVLMKKLIIASIILVPALVLILVVLTYFLKTPVQQSRPQLLQNVSENYNYSNYVDNNNHIDKNDRYCAVWSEQLFGSSITVWDNENNQQTISDASPGFQLNQDYLYYRVKTDLYRRNLLTGEPELLQKRVYKFYIEGDLLFVSLVNGDLLEKNMKTNEQFAISEECDDFWIDGDKVYYTKEICRELYEFSISGRENQYLTFSQDQIFSPLFCGRNRVFVDSFLENFYVYDTETSLQKSIKFPIESLAAGVDRVVLNGSKNKIFISYQARKANGSVVSSRDSEETGLWCLDMETEEKVKISDMIFDSMYMTEDFLFGTVGNDIYSIDLKTFEVQKVN